MPLSQSEKRIAGDQLQWNWTDRQNGRHSYVDGSPPRDQRGALLTGSRVSEWQ